MPRGEVQRVRTCTLAVDATNGCAASAAVEDENEDEEDDDDDELDGTCDRDAGGLDSTSTTRGFLADGGSSPSMRTPPSTRPPTNDGADTDKVAAVNAADDTSSGGRDDENEDDELDGTCDCEADDTRPAGAAARIALAAANEANTDGDTDVTENGSPAGEPYRPAPDMTAPSMPEPNTRPADEDEDDAEAEADACAARSARLATPRCAAAVDATRRSSSTSDSSDAPAPCADCCRSQNSSCPWPALLSLSTGHADAIAAASASARRADAVAAASAAARRATASICARDDDDDDDDGDDDEPVSISGDSDNTPVGEIADDLNFMGTSSRK